MRIKNILIGNFFVLFALPCLASEINENEVVNCFWYGKSTYEKFEIDEDELLVEVGIKDVILNLMNLDVEARKSILEYKLPDDMAHEAHKKKLKEFLELRYISQASCIMDLYRVGDTLREFKKDKGRAVESGYVLLRGKRKIAFVLTGAVYE